MTGMLGMSFTVSGASQVKAKFDAARALVSESLSDKSLAQYLLRRMKDRFKRGVSPEGMAWKSLSSETRPGKPLMKTGNLYKSIGIIEGSPGGLFASPTGAGFRIGIKSRSYSENMGKKSREVDPAEYGVFHQEGIGVPRRRFIGIGSSDVTAVTDKINKELKRMERL
jgi:phage gpG-like protein